MDVKALFLIVLVAARMSCASGKTGISGATREIKEGAKQLGETAKEMREGFKDIREVIKQELGNFSNLTDTTVVTLLKLFNNTVLPEFKNSLYLTNMVLKELCVVMMLLGAFLCRLIINSTITQGVSSCRPVSTCYRSTAKGCLLCVLYRTVVAGPVLRSEGAVRVRDFTGAPDDLVATACVNLDSMFCYVV